MAKLIITGGDIVTMNPGREEIVGGHIVVEDGLITALGPGHGVPDPEAVVIDAAGCVVTPGLINAHQHFTGDPLVACCIPDTITSNEAIFEWAVPIHEHHTADDDEVAATLTALQCLRTGTTTAVEAGTVAHPERVAAGMTAAGIRATLGRWGWDVPDVPYGAPADEVLALQRSLVADWPAGGRVEGWVTLVGHALASDELLAGAAELSRELGVNLTMHMSPTPGDSAEYRERSGKSAIEHLASLDVLGPNVLIAHAVHLDDAELDLLLEHDVSIAYCPWAYLRLGQGVSVSGRHIEFVERGGRLALGADAANAGDHRDLLLTAAVTAGLARDIGYDQFGSANALAHATIEGARAVGMTDRVGSLEVGKAADLVVFDASGLDWGARGDLTMQLVWGNIGSTVRDVIVEGELVIRDRASTKVDEAELIAESRDRKASLLRRAGIDR